MLLFLLPGLGILCLCELMSEYFMEAGFCCFESNLGSMLMKSYKSDSIFCLFQRLENTELYTLTHTHTHTPTWTRTHVQTHVDAHKCGHAHTDTCTHTHGRTHPHTHSRHEVSLCPPYQFFVSPGLSSWKVLHVLTPRPKERRKWERDTECMLTRGRYIKLKIILSLS